MAKQFLSRLAFEKSARGGQRVIWEADRTSRDAGGAQTWNYLF
jgi:hypothetical protein